MPIRTAVQRRKAVFVGMAETYTVSDQQLTFGGLTADFTLEAKALTLSNMQGGECGDVAIWTTKPWSRH